MSGIGRIPVEAFKKGIFQIMQTDAMQAVLADFTGSSLLEILNAKSDLSRRAIVYDHQ